MRDVMIRGRTIAGLTVFTILSGSLLGCATVKPEELDNRLATLQAEMRQEMESGDEQVAQELNGRMDGMEDRMAALEQDLADLESEFDATVERLETAIRFNLPVYFGFDEAEIRTQDRPVLDRFAEVVHEYYPDALITVEGFTDPAGSEEYNLWLGEQRAQAVMTYLTEQGRFSSNSLRMVSYGESAQRQIDRGETGPGMEGWENRRVVLVVDHAG